MIRGAGFCHNCGAPAGGRRAGKPWNWNALSIVLVAVAALGVGSIFVVGQIATEKPEAPSGPRSGAGRSSPPPGQPADLSTMTPRQAADRLFNRVMAADERGDTGEVMRFAPMALKAYQLVDRLDADARYHMGLLDLLSGNLEAAAKQIESLERQAPGHLLALVLSFKVAEKAGDDQAASDSRARFAAAYDAEIRGGRPEYAAHRTTIEKFHASAMGSRTAGTAGRTARRPGRGALLPDRGALLYAKNCAGCHGPSASGSGKGPPLVHQIYQPGHHGDAAFYRAVRQGVQSHHWPFGDMAPVPGVTDDQIGEIVAYVRALQLKDGIK